MIFSDLQLYHLMDMPYSLPPLRGKSPIITFTPKALSLLDNYHLAIRDILAICLLGSLSLGMYWEFIGICFNNWEWFTKYKRIDSLQLSVGGSVCFSILHQAGQNPEFARFFPHTAYLPRFVHVQTHDRREALLPSLGSGLFQPEILNPPTYFISSR